MIRKIVSPSETITSRVIVALDYSNLNNALSFVDHIDPCDCRLKVGKEMFILFGPRIVYELKSRGFEIFLDLKLHDIPNTCARAVIAAAELGVWMISIHALGGIRMMTAAQKALKAFGEDAPLLAAVTILTSMDYNDLLDLGIMLSLTKYAEKLARLAQSCGLDWIICSAKEALYFRQRLGKKLKLITPGIRLQKNSTNDQRRVMTPEQALNVGVDYVVIGRPIIQSVNPIKTLKEINLALTKIT